jgi:hypothetical protein
MEWEALAEQFGVSDGYTKKIRRQQLQSGVIARPRQSRHEPVSRVTVEVKEQLRAELLAASGSDTGETGRAWSEAVSCGSAERACGRDYFAKKSLHTSE